ncbi:MAG: DUF1273 family protein [Clostridia bacterium]|nr:DUF1273 family protein [Clostridia bacterium]
MTTCCFTGHLVIDPADMPMLREQLARCVRALVDAGIRCFRAGGAIGFDRLAAEAVLDARRDYADRFHLCLELMLPCHGQSGAWEPDEQLAYRRILAEADRSFVLQDNYSLGCMQRRNLALLDGCDVCICYRVHSDGGTAYTVEQAHKRNIPVINLAPLCHPAPTDGLFTKN